MFFINQLPNTKRNQTLKLVVTLIGWLGVLIVRLFLLAYSISYSIKVAT